MKWKTEIDVRVQRGPLGSTTSGLDSYSTPPMLLHLCDCESLIDISIQHCFDEVDGWLRHDPRYAQFVIQDLIDAVEWVFFVDEGVEQDAESPDILLFAAVGFALQDFGRCVIYHCGQLDARERNVERGNHVPIVPTKTSKGPFLMYAALPKSMSLTLPSPSRMMFSSLMSR